MKAQIKTFFGRFIIVFLAVICARLVFEAFAPSPEIKETLSIREENLIQENAVLKFRIKEARNIYKNIKLENEKDLSRVDSLSFIQLLDIVSEFEFED